MEPERWQLIEELYHSASGLAGEQRTSFLQKACRGDPGLLNEIESLLRHGSTPQSVLDAPALAIMAKSLASDEYQSSATLLQSKIISHYKVLEPIGRGGMGLVYKAEDLKLQRQVALKLLPQFLSSDPQALQRFEREAQAASALNHPNICTVYEIDEAEGLHFIAIELLEGETLKDRIARGALEVRVIITIAVEICEALEAAHSAGIIHRDIKPSNIVVTQRGAAKLLDFGVAKRVGPELMNGALASIHQSSGDLQLTSPGAAIGTVSYMSPEQADGQDVDARSDLFSLGAVLYEMTTGKSPFPGKDPAQVLRAIRSQQPNAIENLSPRTPSELIRITNRALQKDPSLRYQSAAGLRADLQGLSKRLETRTARRQALLVGALTLLSFALIVFGTLRVSRVHEWVVGHTSTGTVREIKSLAVLPLENLTQDPSQEYFADGMTDALITNFTKIGALRVISRTSVMHYKGSHTTLPEIAKELNVNAVVEGTVSRSADRVRISARLVDAGNGQNLWARDYDRDLRDVLKLESELAQAVALEVAGKLSPQDQSRVAPKPREIIPRAYDAYLKGEYFLDKWTADGFAKSKEYFEQSIALDPSYADAYAGLAEYYGTVAFMGMVPPREAWLKSEDLLVKALEMDATSSKAHSLLGMLKLYFRCDRGAAEKELSLALTLNPGDMRALDYHSYYLLEIGRTDEAIAEKKRVLEHDPVRVITNSDLGLYLLQAGRSDEAIVQLQKTLELDPNDSAAHARLGKAYAAKGQYPEAVIALKKAISLDSIPGRLALLGEVYARWGKRRKALETIRQLQRMSMQEHVAPNMTALIYSRLHEKEAAIAWLQKAKPEDYPKISDPGFESVRSDPRFKILEARLKPDQSCPLF